MNHIYSLCYIYKQYSCIKYKFYMCNQPKFLFLFVVLQQEPFFYTWKQQSKIKQQYVLHIQASEIPNIIHSRVSSCSPSFLPVFGYSNLEGLFKPFFLPSKDVVPYNHSNQPSTSISNQYSLKLYLKIRSLIFILIRI